MSKYDKLQELQEQRNEAAATMRKLGEAFEANGKKWKPGEDQAWEAAVVEYDRAKAALAELRSGINCVSDRLAAVDRDSNAVDERLARVGLPDAYNGMQGGRPLPGRDGHGALQLDRPMFRDMASGREIPALLNSDRLSRERAEHDNDEAMAPVGALLHSMLTGQPQNITRGQWHNAIGSNDSQGGYILNPGLSGQILDLARSASVAMRAGAMTLPMDVRELSIARITSDPTPMWRAEGQAVQGSTVLFDRVTLRAKTLAVAMPVTIELLEDAANAERIITQCMQAALGAELDRAILMGAGNENEPRGIRNQSGVGSIASVGTPTDYSDLSEAVGQVLAANYPGGASGLAWVAHPRDAETYDGLTDSTGQPLNPTPWARDLQRFTTTSLPTDEGGGSDESIGIVGDFSQVLVGMRTTGANVRILDAGTVTDADSVTHNAASELKKLIVAYIRADVALLRPSWMTVLSGITAA
ncbi:MAG: phage major capsid protein [Planctomycetaceae bacterium]|nr:phage major capsid protein [Planctomycetaceae bacterium]